MVRDKIEVGDKELISDGMAVSYGDEPITISLGNEADFEEDNALSFRFKFVDDGGDPDINMSQVSDKMAEVSILNHGTGSIKIGGASAPQGPLKPIDLGEIDGRILSLIYQVELRKDAESEEQVINFYYNFYLGEKTSESEYEDETNESAEGEK